MFTKHTKEWYRQQAQKLYPDPAGEIQIDNKATVEILPTGGYVQAWIHIDSADIKEILNAR